MLWKTQLLEHIRILATITQISNLLKILKSFK